MRKTRPFASHELRLCCLRASSCSEISHGRQEFIKVLNAKLNDVLSRRKRKVLRNRSDHFICLGFKAEKVSHPVDENVKVYKIGSSCSDSRSSEEIGCDLLYLGIVMGCLPVLGLRLSTLECFYNSTCLNRLTTLINSAYTLPPLDQLIATRFSPISSTTVGTLIDELFIESWENTSNHSAYFSLCAPSACRYTYVERYSALYMLTTIVGLYGGLTVGLKFLIWHVLRLYWKARRWLNVRRTRVEPVNTS